MTKTKIRQVRYLEVKEIRKHREELIGLAGWICELFGYVMYKPNNKPDFNIKKSTTRSDAIPAITTKEIIHRKVAKYRKFNYQQYSERVEGQRC
jgi:hypothetical protein